MTDELKTDAEAAISETKAAIASLGTEETKVAVWYKSHQFYAGLIAGVLACGLVATVVLVKHL